LGLPTRKGSKGKPMRSQGETRRDMVIGREMEYRLKRLVVGSSAGGRVALQREFSYKEFCTGREFLLQSQGRKEEGNIIKGLFLLREGKARLSLSSGFGSLEG